MPRRGLHALSFAVVTPALFLPLFLSYRRPRFAVSRFVTCQESFRNAPYVTKAVSCASRAIGLYWKIVDVPLLFQTG